MPSKSAGFQAIEQSPSPPRPQRTCRSEGVRRPLRAPTSTGLLPFALRLHRREIAGLVTGGRDNERVVLRVEVRAEVLACAREPVEEPPDDEASGRASRLRGKRHGGVGDVG